MIFNADTHSYIHDGQRVRSVTGMIKAAGLLGPAAAFYSKDSAARGTRIHQACLDFDKGVSLDMDDDEAMYVDSYAHWCELCHPIWTAMEEPRYSERLNFAGTADRVGIMNDRPVLVDLKTGSAAAWHGIQLALYDILYDEMPPMIRRRLVVHLRKDGRIPQVVEYSDHNDYAIAFTLLEGQHNDRHNDAQPQGKS